MDEMMDAILFFTFLFCIFLIILGIASISTGGPEITSQEYILVAEMIEKNPAIKPEVDRLMEDNRISPFEYADLNKSEAKLRVKNAR